MKRFKVDGASPTSDFHRASLEMGWLRLCLITNESTETENCYKCLNRELRWLWNSVCIAKRFKTRLSTILSAHAMLEPYLAARREVRLSSINDVRIVFFSR